MKPKRSVSQKSSNNARRGYTLIEMLVAITAGIVVMVVAAGMLNTLMRLEQQSHKRFTERAAVARLADQFRRDAHAALEATPIAPEEGKPADGLAWRFTLADDHRVEYRSDLEGLLRTKSLGDRTTAEERYAFATSVRAAVDLDSTGNVPMVRLRLEGVSVPGGDAPMPPLVVEARLAFDHRFTQVKEHKP